MFERQKALKAIGEKLQEVQMNLENNYKDQTIQALKEAQQVYEQYRNSGLLKEKDIAQIEAKLKEYDEYYRPESESKTLPLPVYKVEVDNKTQDLYYFPSSAPTYYHYNSNTKLRKKISDFATY